MSTPQRNTFIKATIFLFFVALIFLLSVYGSQALSVLGSWGENLGKLYTEKKSVAEFLTSLGYYSPIFFILLQALQVVIAVIPGELTGIVGGYVYGVSFGFIFSTLGLALGSLVAFELAKILGRPFVERFVNQKLVKKFEFLTTDTGATLCFLLFLIPGFPKDVLCYLLGLSRMKLTTFLVLSTLARTPGTFLLTLQGASIRSQRYHTAGAVAATGVVVIFTAYLYRAQLYQWIKGRSKADVQH